MQTKVFKLWRFAVALMGKIPLESYVFAHSSRVCSRSRNVDLLGMNRIMDFSCIIVF